MGFMGISQVNVYEANNEKQQIWNSPYSGIYSIFYKKALCNDLGQMA